MNESSTVVEHSLAEMHSHDNKHQAMNLTHNQSHLVTSKNVIPMAKKRAMNPTPLYVSVFSSTIIKYVLFLLDNTLSVPHIQ